MNGRKAEVVKYSFLHFPWKLIKRINDLIADVMRDGYEGIGKPESLRSELSGR
ncbi:hypothetical protein Acsp01_03440 [Actinoplanes sp. NBRC 101535]|nr:hypothetical protein Acsp01_03440 [Actinoplanes sp. NBRC 101535]